MDFKAILFSLLPLFLLASCAVPLRVSMPTSPFIDTSETLGKEGKMKAAVQLGMQPRVILSPDLVTTDANTVNPALDNYGTWAHGGFTFALDPAIDVEARLPFGARAKFQIFRDDDPDEGPSVAASIGVGYVPQNESDTQTFNGTSQTTTYNVNNWGGEASLQAGYRVSKWILVYGGVLFSFGSSTGRYSVDARSIPSRDFTIHQTNWIPSVGVEFKAKRWTFREINSFIYVNAGQSSNTYAAAGGEVAFSFGGD